ncbi:acyltransferase family protein [Bradyrhizobium ottawaense]|uniref:acyltransferase family protein n=1 Tax=Bradyrhizobium ottawaense TaxID=931866 RepID=UPI003399E491
MEASEARRFVVLDFYRFVAALGVFIFHLKLIDTGISPAWNGSYGLFVDMFFILSGFVISYSYPSDARGVAAYSRFMIRRIARIYPLHLLSLLIFVVLIGVGLERTARSTPLDFLYNLLLLQAWGVTDHLSFNSPSWSISAEFFCYLIFPLLMLLARKMQPIVLGAIVAALYLVLAHGHLPIWQERSQMYGANFDYGMLRALPSFLNGILLAILFRMSHPYRHKRMIFAGIGTFGLSVLVLNVFAKPDLAILLFSCAILLTAVGESAFKEFPGAPPARTARQHLICDLHAARCHPHCRVQAVVDLARTASRSVRPLRPGVLCGPDHRRGPHLRLFRESGAALHQPLGRHWCHVLAQAGRSRHPRAL